MYPDLDFVSIRLERMWSAEALLRLLEQSSSAPERTRMNITFSLDFKFAYGLSPHGNLTYYGSQAPP